MPKSIKWSLRSLNPLQCVFPYLRRRERERKGVMVIPTNIDPLPRFLSIDNEANETTAAAGQSVLAT